MNIRAGVVAAALGVAVGMGGAGAATLDIRDGVLFGASDVVVGDKRFDVLFVDGSCVALFNGCNDVGDFDFSDINLAFRAAQALLDQVLIDVPGFAFDTGTAPINGCGTSEFCSVFIPIFPTFVDDTLPFATVFGAFNARRENFADGSFFTFDTQTSVDTSGDDFSVYAQFNQVPVPAALPLLLGGLGVLGLVGRRRRG